MNRDLLIELGLVFMRESDAIVQPYAWPPRAPLSDDEASGARPPQRDRETHLLPRRK